MVNKINTWEIAYKNKIKADKEWDEALASKDINRIKSAMSMCQITEHTLLQEEARIREQKIAKIPYNQFNKEDVEAEKKRLEYIRRLKEI